MRLIAKTTVVLMLLTMASRLVNGDSSATWTGAINQDLKIGSNWSPSGIPDAQATFDSNTVSGTKLNPTANTLFSIEEFYFPTSASLFTFTFSGPGALEFTGAGLPSISGSPTNTRLDATNAAFMTTPQIFFSGTYPTAVEYLGNATIMAYNEGTITTGEYGEINIAQVTLGDAADFESIDLQADAGVSISVTNSGVVTSFNGDAAQVLMQNSSFNSSGDITIALIQSTGEISGSYDVGQMVFDSATPAYPFTGSFEANSATLSFTNDATSTISGGEAQYFGDIGQMVFQGSTFLVEDNVSASFVNAGVLSGNETEDVGQMVFDGNGFSSSLVSFTAGSVTLDFTNQGQIKMEDNGYDAGQMVFDGNGEGSAIFEVTTGDATLTFTNERGSSITSDDNDAGQMVFDGTFAGNAVFEVIDGDATLTFTNEGGSSITSNSHDAGQMVFDGSNSGIETSFKVPNGTATLTFANESGSTISGTNDVGQMVFDWTSPGYSSIGSFEANNATFSFTNDATSTISGGETQYFGDIGQMIFQGGSTLLVEENATFALVNAGMLSGYLTNDVGQMVLDASSITVGSTTINFENTGSISATSSWDAGQMVIDGDGGIASFEVTDGNATLTFMNDCGGSIASDVWNAGQMVLDGGTILVSESTSEGDEYTDDYIENDDINIVVTGSTLTFDVSGTYDSSATLTFANERGSTISANTGNDAGQMVFAGESITVTTSQSDGDQIGSYDTQDQNTTVDVVGSTISFSNEDDITLKFINDTSFVLGNNDAGQMVFEAGSISVTATQVQGEEYGSFDSEEQTIDISIVGNVISFSAGNNTALTFVNDLGSISANNNNAGQMVIDAGSVFVKASQTAGNEDGYYDSQSQSAEIDVTGNIVTFSPTDNAILTFTNNAGSISGQKDTGQMVFDAGLVQIGANQTVGSESGIYDSEYQSIDINITGNTVTFSAANGATLSFANENGGSIISTGIGGGESEKAGQMIFDAGVTAFMLFQSESGNIIANGVSNKATFELTGGDATLTFANEGGSSITSNSGVGGQMVFEGYSHNVASFSAAENATLTFANNEGSLIISDDSYAGQMVFDGNDAGIALFLATENATLTFVNEAGSTISGTSSTGQMVFNGADSGTVFDVMKGDATLTFINDYGSSITSSGFDAGQMVFDTVVGYVYFNVNSGDATLTFANKGGSSIINSDGGAGQMIFDGIANGSLAQFEVFNSSATLTFANDEGSTISASGSGNDAGQMVFIGNDGQALFLTENGATLTFTNQAGSSLTSSDSDAGQMIFAGENDGNATFEVASGGATLTFANDNAEISSGYDAGQMVFDGNNDETATFSVTNSATLTFTNEGGGSITSDGHDAGQMMFDGNNGGHASFSATGGGATLTFTNDSGSSISSGGGGNDAGQMVFDGYNGGNATFSVNGGNATLTFANDSGSTISTGGTDIGQMLFYGVYDGNTTFEVIGGGATLTFENDGGSMITNGNVVGQMVFDGHISGNATFSVTEDATLTFANDGGGLISGTFYVGQMLFDGVSGNASFSTAQNATLTFANAGGSSILSLNDTGQMLFAGGDGAASFSAIDGDATLKFSNEGGSTISGGNGDVGQMVFDSAGVEYGLVASFEADSAILSFTNDATSTITDGFNVGQMLFDGSSISVGSATLNFENQGILSVTSGWDAGQMVFYGGEGSLASFEVTDGDATLTFTNDCGGSISVASGLNAGQMVFDGGAGGGGSASFEVTDGDATLTFANKESSTISATYSAGQMVFDGDSDTASFEVTGDTTLTFTNDAGSMIISNNFDAGQMVFEGHGGTVSFGVTGDTILIFTNEEGSSITSNGHDAGQMVFDSDEGGIASFEVTDGNTTLTFTNEEGSLISSVNNDAGQMVFDGGGSAGPVFFTAYDGAILAFINERGSSISGSQDVGQMVFDGKVGGRSSFMASDGALLTFANDNGSSILSVGNNAGQMLFDGDTSGNANFTLTDGNVTLTFANEFGSTISGSHDVGQMVFDSAGVDYSFSASFEANSATLSFTNDATSTISGGGEQYLGDVGQMIFQGGSTFLVTEDVSASFVNAGALSGGLTENVGQMVFDGDGYSSLPVSFTAGNAVLNFINEGQIEMTLGFSAGQMMFDGHNNGDASFVVAENVTLTFENEKGGLISGSYDAGQMMFSGVYNHGSASFEVTDGNAMLTFVNEGSSSISGIIDAGQMVFDGNNDGSAIFEVTGGNATLTFVNESGCTVSGGNDAGQMVFDGSFGGEANFEVPNGNATLSFANEGGSTISGTHDVGQMVFDSANPEYPFMASFEANNATFSFLNDATSTISSVSQTQYLGNAGQMIFDTSSLFLIDEDVKASFVNDGAILGDSTFEAGQIVFDASSFNADNATLNFTNTGTISLNNGWDAGQMAFDGYYGNAAFTVDDNATLNFINDFAGIISVTDSHNATQMVVYGDGSTASFSANTAKLAFTNDHASTITSVLGYGDAAQMVVGGGEGSGLFTADTAMFTFVNRANSTILAAYNAGQMVIDADSGIASVVITDSLTSSFKNDEGSTISGGLDSGQMIITGFNPAVYFPCTASLTAGSIDMTFINSGGRSIFNESNAGQMVVDANDSPASCGVTNNATLAFVNQFGSTISGSNDVGQMLLEAVNSDLASFEAGTATFSFLNDSTSIISSLHDTGQMMFRGNTLFSVGDRATFSFKNDGVISGSAQDVGQMVFDGGECSIGSALLEFDNKGSISTANDAGQMVFGGGGAPAAFNVTNGDATLNFMNDSGGTISGLAVAQMLFNMGANSTHFNMNSDDAILTFVNKRGSSIFVPDGGHDAGQMAFLGTTFTASNSALLTFVNDQSSISGGDDAGQMIFDGAGETAFFSVTNGNATLNFTNESGSLMTSSGGHVGQMIFDANDGTVSFSATGDANLSFANESGSTISGLYYAGEMVFPGASFLANTATLSFTNDATSEISCFSNDSYGDAAQMVFAQNSSFSTQEGLSLSFVNDGIISGNSILDVGQMVFDHALFSALDATLSFMNTGAISVTTGRGVAQMAFEALYGNTTFSIGQDATLTFMNDAGGTISAMESARSAAQMAFYADANIAVFNATNATLSFVNDHASTITSFSGYQDAAQMIFGGVHGSANFEVPNVELTFANCANSTISAANNAGQMVFDAVLGTVTFSASENATLVFSNEDGSTILASGNAGDSGQMVFNGFSSAADFMAGSADMTFVNGSGSSISLQEGGWDSGQMVFDASYGSVSFQVDSNATLTFINDAGSVINGNHDAAQMVFDANNGSATMTVGNKCIIRATNNGDIYTEPEFPAESITSRYAAQILFDGSLGGVSLDVGDNSAITALNTYMGTITNEGVNPAAQIYFSSATVTGAPTITAINQQVIPTIEGIVFDGTSTAYGVNIILQNTSLVVNTAADPFIIASLTGDSRSFVKLSTNLNIDMPTDTDTIFAGEILDVSGSNSLTVSGDGTLELSGASTYGGGTYLISGELIVGNDNALGTGVLSITSGATLDLLNHVVLPNNIILSGRDYFEVDNHDCAALAGVLSGTGSLNKVGTGKLDLVKNSFGYLGTANVEQGHLAVNASYPNMTVNVLPGTVLSGIGTMGNVNCHGTFSPGNSIGTCFVNNLTFYPRSIYEVEIGYAESSDCIVASGNVVIETGAALDVIPLTTSFFDGEVYTIIEAYDGIVTGQFLPLTLQFRVYSLSVVYNPQNVELVISSGGGMPDFDDLLPDDATGNDHAVAEYLDCLETANAIDPYSDLAYVFNVLDFATPQELEQGFSTLDPGPYSNFVVAQQNALIEFRYTLSDRFDLLRTTSPCTCSDMPQLGIWVTPVGGFSRQKAEINEPLGYKTHSYGVTVGADVDVCPELHLGIAGAYIYDHVTGLASTPTGASSTGKIETGYLALYGSWFSPLFYLDVAGTIAFDDYKTKRPIYLTSIAGTIDRTAKGSYSGIDYDIYIAGGSVMQYYEFDLTLGASIDWIGSHQDGFTEKGADSLNLVLGSHNNDLLRSLVGFNVSYNGWCSIIPEIGCAVAYDRRFGHDRYSTHFVDEPCNMSVRGINPSQWLALPEAKVTGCFGNGWTLSLIYDGEFGEYYFANDFSLNVALEF